MPIILFYTDLRFCNLVCCYKTPNAVSYLTNSHMQINIDLSIFLFLALDTKKHDIYGTGAYCQNQISHSSIKNKHCNNHRTLPFALRNQSILGCAEHFFNLDSNPFRISLKNTI